jgi:branched-chain amino acid transport system permease protein
VIVELAQQIANGLAVGAIYGLVALTFVLIYKATEVVSFAQGDLLMVGAFLAWTFVVPAGFGAGPFGYFAALVLAVLLTALLGGALDRFVMRRIIGQPHFAGIMLTIGLAFATRGIATLVWGPDERSLPTPFTQKTTTISGVVLPDAWLAIAAGTVALCAGLFAFFRFTRMGVAMQAASQNQLAAYLVAIDVKRLNTLAWALAAGVAALAGVLIAPILTVDTNLWLIVLKGFGAAVLGGFGSIPGALVGGALIGVAEQIVGVYYDPSAKGIVAHVVLLAVLLVWPRGLFGEPVAKRV